MRTVTETLKEAARKENQFALQRIEIEPTRISFEEQLASLNLFDLKPAADADVARDMIGRVAVGRTGGIYFQAVRNPRNSDEWENWTLIEPNVVAKSWTIVGELIDDFFVFWIDENNVIKRKKTYNGGSTWEATETVMTCPAEPGHIAAAGSEALFFVGLEGGFKVVYYIDLVPGVGWKAWKWPFHLRWTGAHCECDAVMSTYGPLLAFSGEPEGPQYPEEAHHWQLYTLAAKPGGYFRILGPVEPSDYTKKVAYNIKPRFSASRNVLPVFLTAETDREIDEDRPLVIFRSPDFRGWGVLSVLPKYDLEQPNLIIFSDTIILGDARFVYMERNTRLFGISSTERTIDITDHCTAWSANWPGLSKAGSSDITVFNEGGKFTGHETLAPGSEVRLYAGYKTEAGDELVKLGAYNIDVIDQRCSRDSNLISVKARDGTKRLRQASDRALVFRSASRFYKDFQEQDDLAFFLKNIGNSVWEWDEERKRMVAKARGERNFALCGFYEERDVGIKTRFRMVSPWYDLDWKYRVRLYVHNPGLHPFETFMIRGTWIQFVINPPLSEHIYENCQGDADDLWVIYWDEELEMWMILSSWIYEWSPSQIRLTFPIAQSLDYCEIDSNYYLYYGNPWTEEPPDRFEPTGELEVIDCMYWKCPQFHAPEGPLWEWASVDYVTHCVRVWSYADWPVTVWNIAYTCPDPSTYADDEVLWLKLTIGRLDVLWLGARLEIFVPGVSSGDPADRGYGIFVRGNPANTGPRVVRIDGATTVDYQDLTGPASWTATNYYTECQLEIAIKNDFSIDGKVRWRHVSWPSVILSDNEADYPYEVSFSFPAYSPASDGNRFAWGAQGGDDINVRHYHICHKKKLPGPPIPEEKIDVDYPDEPEERPENPEETVACGGVLFGIQETDCKNGYLWLYEHRSDTLKLIRMDNEVFHLLWESGTKGWAPDVDYSLMVIRQGNTIFCWSSMDGKDFQLEAEVEDGTYGLGYVGIFGQPSEFRIGFSEVHAFALRRDWTAEDVVHSIAARACVEETEVEKKFWVEGTELSEADWDLDDAIGNWFQEAEWIRQDDTDYAFLRSKYKAKDMTVDLRGGLREYSTLGILLRCSDFSDITEVNGFLLYVELPNGTPILCAAKVESGAIKPIFRLPAAWLDIDLTTEREYRFSCWGSWFGMFVDDRLCLLVHDETFKEGYFALVARNEGFFREIKVSSLDLVVPLWTLNPNMTYLAGLNFIAGIQQCRWIFRDNTLVVGRFEPTPPLLSLKDEVTSSTRRQNDLDWVSCVRVVGDACWAEAYDEELLEERGYRFLLKQESTLVTTEQCLDAALREIRERKRRLDEADFDGWAQVALEVGDCVFYENEKDGSEGQYLVEGMSFRFATLPKNFSMRVSLTKLPLEEVA